MSLLDWLFLGLLFICLMVVGLSVDYAQSKNRGWTPAYTLLLFWKRKHREKDGKDD